METKSYSFKGVDWAKIGRGALVAVVGALLTYATTIIPMLHIPDAYLPIVTVVMGVLVNVARKWASPVV